MTAREEGVGRPGERGEGLNRYKLVVKSGHGNREYDIRNVVSIVVAMGRTRWVTE